MACSGSHSCKWQCGDLNPGLSDATTTCLCHAEKKRIDLCSVVPRAVPGIKILLWVGKAFLAIRAGDDWKGLPWEIVSCHHGNRNRGWWILALDDGIERIDIFIVRRSSTLWR